MKQLSNSTSILGYKNVIHLPFATNQKKKTSKRTRRQQITVRLATLVLNRNLHSRTNFFASSIYLYCTKFNSGINNKSEQASIFNWIQLFIKDFLFKYSRQFASFYCYRRSWDSAGRCSGRVFNKMKHII